MTRWLHARPMVLVGLAAAALLGALIFGIARSARLTLGYVDSLRWPIAALALVFLFRRPLTELLDRTERGKVATPFGSAEFEGGRRPNQAAEALPAHDPAEAVLDEHPGLLEEREPAFDQQQIDEFTIEYLEEQVELYRLLNLIFQAQITFLTWVRAAPEGVTVETAQHWYEVLQRTNPGWTDVDLGGFANFLFNSGLLEVSPDGTYRVSERGGALVDLANQAVYAQKAF
jgi:hypothetical protein